MGDAVAGKPGTLRHHEVRDQGQNSDTTHNDRRVYRSMSARISTTISTKENLTIQSLTCDRPGIGREQDGHNPSIPKYTDELERLAPSAKTPRWLGEAFRSAEQSAQTDEAVRSCTWNTSRRDERSESHIGRENSAGNDRSDHPDDDDCVTGLTVVHFGDPAREWKHTITGNGKDKARRGDNGDGSVLEIVIRNDQKGTRWCSLTSHKATTQMTFIGIWPPRPSTWSYSGTNG